MQGMANNKKKKKRATEAALDSQVVLQVEPADQITVCR